LRAPCRKHDNPIRNSLVVCNRTLFSSGIHYFPTAPYPRVVLFFHRIVADSFSTHVCIAIRTFNVLPQIPRTSSTAQSSLPDRSSGRGRRRRRLALSPTSARRSSGTSSWTRTSSPALGWRNSSPSSGSDSIALRKNWCDLVRFSAIWSEFRLLGS